MVVTGCGRARTWWRGMTRSFRVAERNQWPKLNHQHTWLPPVGSVTACQNDPELWWPVHTPDARAAALCNRCEFRDQCLEASIVQGEGGGIWGGLPGVTRQRMMRARRVRVRGQS